MKKFNKTLLAAALMVAAGSANASLSTTGTSSEAYLSVYDSTSTNTYALGLGVTFATLLADKANGTLGNISINLNDANWVAFKAAANLSTTVWGVIDANGTTGKTGTIVATSGAVGGLPAAATQASFVTSITNVGLHANEINGGLATSAVSNSVFVKDGINDGTGQDKNLANLFGAQNGASISGAYGSSLGFYAETKVGSGLAIAAFDKVWTLKGDTLSFAAAPVATVPVPAAVWMFGAGLMGVLRLNRRKSMAV